MLYIVSPAKQMVQADDVFACQDVPCFMPKTERILRELSSYTYEELKALWKCSDAIAQENYERLAHMDLHQHLTPAVFSYVGIQYQNLAASVMTQEQLDYLQSHLCILSGFYGLVRPFDGITPYRLEMQSKLSIDGSKNLYDYWGEDIAHRLCEMTQDQAQEDRTIVNIASTEYSKAVVPHLKKREDVPVVTCLFGTIKDGKLVQRSTESKAARGTFMNWCAAENVTTVEQLDQFKLLGYYLNESLSTPDTRVFIHE